jgi:hypothetical protein
MKTHKQTRKKHKLRHSKTKKSKKWGGTTNEPSEIKTDSQKESNSHLWETVYEYEEKNKETNRNSNKKSKLQEMSNIKNLSKKSKLKNVPKMQNTKPKTMKTFGKLKQPSKEKLDKKRDELIQQRNERLKKREQEKVLEQQRLEQQQLKQILKQQRLKKEEKEREILNIVKRQQEIWEEQERIKQEQIKKPNLFYFNKCNSLERCSKWLGPLNGNNKIGCGINILKFMDEIDENTANNLYIYATTTGQGTPFNFIVDWFNKKMRNNKINVRVYEYIFNIGTVNKFTNFFNYLFSVLINNTCIMVKFNRDISKAKQRNLTPGHYVLISKHDDNTLWTYEPIYSNINNCVKKQFFYGNHDKIQRMFNAFNNQFYISSSVLALTYSDTKYINVGGKKSDLNIYEHIEEEFIDSIFNSIECDIKYLKTVT